VPWVEESDNSPVVALLFFQQGEVEVPKSLAEEGEGVANWAPILESPDVRAERLGEGRRRDAGTRRRLYFPGCYRWLQRRPGA
jgi:hypothetical protein